MVILSISVAAKILVTGVRWGHTNGTENTTGSNLPVSVIQVAGTLVVCDTICGVVPVMRFVPKLEKREFHVLLWYALLRHGIY